MEHFITAIRIDELRHLSNIVITLNPDSRQNLMITGKNGSGKTSLLQALQKYLITISNNQLFTLDSYVQQLQLSKELMKKAKSDTQYFKAKDAYQEYLLLVKKYKDGAEAVFNDVQHLETLYKRGKFIIAFFPANRKTQILRANGVEDIKLKESYGVNEKPGELLHKYMVHLKTQQAYAANEGNAEYADRIQKWFDRFVNALRILMEDNSVTLEYDYRAYDFKIHEDGRKPFGFDVLSDGYSAVIHIVSDLILRMDKNWLLEEGISEYNIEGVALIDELETHLHIGLQKKIMPFLTSFFPRIQFIVTTHSPYILNSISNAKAYDLENCIELENLSLYSSDGLAEGYFGADEYASELKDKLNQYQYLVGKTNPTEQERAQRAKLRSELKNIPKGFSTEARDKFEEIEGMRV